MDETTQGTPQPAGTQAKGMTLYRPAIIALLYLLNIVLGFSVFVGLVLAYVWRGEAETQEWEKTHYTYLIRTFWIGFALCVAIFLVWMAMMFGTVLGIEEAGPNAAPPASLFAAMFGGMAVWMLAAIWFFIRCVLSLVKAGDQQPMPNPQTWLF